MRRQTLSRSRKALGGTYPPTPLLRRRGGKWRLGAAEASSGAGAGGREGGCGVGRRGGPGRARAEASRG